MDTARKVRVCFGAAAAATATEPQDAAAAAEEIERQIEALQAEALEHERQRLERKRALEASLDSLRRQRAKLARAGGADVAASEQQQRPARSSPGSPHTVSDDGFLLQGCKSRRTLSPSITRGSVGGGFLGGGWRPCDADACEFSSSVAAGGGPGERGLSSLLIGAAPLAARKRKAPGDAGPLLLLPPPLMAAIDAAAATTEQLPGPAAAAPNLPEQPRCAVQPVLMVEPAASADALHRFAPASAADEMDDSFEEEDPADAADAAAATVDEPAAATSTVTPLGPDALTAEAADALELVLQEPPCSLAAMGRVYLRMSELLSDARMVAASGADDAAEAAESDGAAGETGPPLAAAAPVWRKAREALELARDTARERQQALALAQQLEAADSQ